MSNSTATMAKPVRCSECGDTFKDLRGLNGHLRFVHDYGKEELREALDEAKEVIAEREAIEAMTVEDLDPVMKAMDRLVRSKNRLDAAEEIFQKMKKKDVVGGRFEIGFLTPTIPERKVAKEYVERCEQEHEDAKKALEVAIEQEAEHRE